jgi:hypothetical protein
MVNTPLIELKNLGPKSASWLNQMGLFTRGDLESCNILEVYKVLKQQHGASLNMLWSLQGALLELNGLKLPKQIKEDLLNKLSHKSLL